MQISATPIKWTIPFAANDSAKVEIPATTADPTRFSLSLGSPPLTGQPPESGGVPPQLEDFNGAVNQIARFTWWAMGGGPLPYDATWSADPNVNGYAKGAMISTADGQGDWISVVDNNTANPDTVGTNWVPGYNYGSLALTGQTGGTVTLTPAQAVKRSMSIAGALTSNLVIVVPTWLQEWTVTNTTTGAFTVTVKTAAGSGVVIPQNSSPTTVAGDGTNVTQLAKNIAPATVSTHAAQLSQTLGRVLNIQSLAVGSGTYTPTAGTRAISIRLCAGGGGGGGSTTAAAYGGGGGGGYGEWYGLLTALGAGPTYAYTVGAGGTAGASGGGAGGAGGTTSLASPLFVATGGAGGTTASGAGGTISVSLAGALLIAAGHEGQGPVGTVGGGGGNAFAGAGGVGHVNAGGAGVAGSGGAGGGNSSSTAYIGGAGGAGYLIITEYA